MTASALVSKVPSLLLYVIAAIVSSAAAACVLFLLGCRSETPSVKTPALAVDPVFGASAQWDNGPKVGAQLPKVEVGSFEFGSMTNEVDPVRGVGPSDAPQGPSAADVEAAVANGVARGLASLPPPAAGAPTVVYAPAPAAEATGVPHERHWGRVVLFAVLIVGAIAATLYFTKRLGRVLDWFGGLFRKAKKAVT